MALGNPSRSLPLESRTVSNTRPSQEAGRSCLGANFPSVLSAHTFWSKAGSERKSCLNDSKQILCLPAPPAAPTDEEMKAPAGGLIPREETSQAEASGMALPGFHPKRFIHS